jgi:hypothetical protein
MGVNLEREPTRGRYPVSAWRTGELALDRDTLTLPADVAPGTDWLIVGVYQASDDKRLTTRFGISRQPRLL